MGSNIEQSQGDLLSGGSNGNLSWGVTTQGSSWDTLTVLRREVWED
jgi:hypothetical protein